MTSKPARQERAHPRGNARRMPSMSLQRMRSPCGPLHDGASARTSSMCANMSVASLSWNPTSKVPATVSWRNAGVGAPAASEIGISR